MHQCRHLPFLTLTLLISFASVNAVLFTPSLPSLAIFFNISEKIAQYTITWFLVGYALGQLLYGPLAKRYGRKNALYIGIGLQIIASLGCVLAGLLHFYPLLLGCRVLLALGSGVGLKMTFTLVNECYEPKIASQKISYLLLAFAITPGLAVALGGFLTTTLGWQSCFIAGAAYGALLLIFVKRLSITEMNNEHNALKWHYLKKSYQTLFHNKDLIAGGLLMGSSTCFVYLFAALAPFIVINILGMNSEQYGVANLLPSLGLVIGSLLCAYLVKKISLSKLILIGIVTCALGTILMIIALGLDIAPIVAIFSSMVLVNIGLSFILSNASTIAMSAVEDKANGSAVMNFINMGLATFMVLLSGLFTLHAMILPLAYLLLCIFMLPLYGRMKLAKSNS